MSKVISRIQKRNKWPVKLGDETIFIRAMTKREQREAREIAAPDGATQIEKSAAMELRGYFVFGCIILEDDGAPSFQRAEGESSCEFAARIDLKMEDVPEDFKAAILDELNRIQTAPGTLPKN